MLVRLSGLHPRSRALDVIAVAACMFIAGAVLAACSSGGTTTAPNSPGTSAAPGTGSTIPVEARGVLRVDPSPRFGQSPSNGSCARWSERFVNDSTATVVGITFPVASARFSRGRPGSADYREYPAATPPVSKLNVRIAPKASRTIQFMSCTSTAPPAGVDALHIAPPTRIRWTWEDGAESSAPFRSAP